MRSGDLAPEPLRLSQLPLHQPSAGSPPHARHGEELAASPYRPLSRLGAPRTLGRRAGNQASAFRLAGFATPHLRSATVTDDPKPPFPDQPQPMPGLTRKMEPVPDHGEE